MRTNLTRDLKGRYASTKSFINRNAIAIIFIPLGLMVAVSSAHAQKPQIPVASLETRSPYEQLVDRLTKERMENPEFIKDTEQRARMDVVMAISNKAQLEMYNELHHTK